MRFKIHIELKYIKTIAQKAKRKEIAFKCSCIYQDVIFKNTNMYWTLIRMYVVMFKTNTNRIV